MSNKTITLKVLGFDPSLNNWGYCLGKVTYNFDSKDIYFKVSDVGVFTKKEDKTIKYVNEKDFFRAKEIFSKTIYLLDDIDIIVAEIPVGSQSARAMASYGICLGLLSTLPVMSPNSYFFFINPKDLKKKSVGHITATKQEIISWVSTNYPEVNFPKKTIKNVSSIIASKSEHMADAVCAVHAVLDNISTTIQQRYNHANITKTR